MRLKIVLLGNLRTKLYTAGHCREQSGDIQNRQTQDTLGPTPPRLMCYGGKKEKVCFTLKSIPITYMPLDLVKLTSALM